jgi:MFS transporter, putative metabolite:H+ symporter
MAPPEDFSCPPIGENVMSEAPRAATTTFPASHVLGSKLDSIPFSPFHLGVIVVLGLVALVDGYDGSMTGTLLVLAKKPLNIAPGEIRFLAVASSLAACVGGFAAAAISDHWSRRTVMLLGVVGINFFTLLIPLAQSGEHLIVIRLLTGLAIGFAASAPFPIAAELMPAQHRRTYGAIYEMMLASSFTLVPLAGFIVNGTPDGFRLLALPAVFGLFVVPALVYLAIPESPRWHLRRGYPEAAIAVVNRIIGRSGNRVTPLTLAGLGENLALSREPLPPLRALFRRGQVRWTVVGIVSLVCAQVSYFTISVLLPKALVDQGAAVSLSFGVTTLVFAASIPGKGFTGFLMEIIGRRWTITYCLAGSLPGLLAMALAHTAGSFKTVVFVAGALITGFTVLSTFTAVRVYLSEQFPTALRGRGQYFGESCGRFVAGVVAPYLLEPYTGSPMIFFGTLAVVASIGAFVPVLFGKETVGQLETVSERVPVVA